MIIRFRWLTAAALGMGGLCLAGTSSAETSHVLADQPVDLVNPVIGNPSDRGNTAIGPTLPHGSVHPGPDSYKGGTSGYKIGMPTRGFSQLHVSGTGWSTYGNILISPQIGLAIKPGDADSLLADEIATPYSYQATLTRFGIKTLLAPTRNAVMYRFTFPQSDQMHLVLDLAHQLPGHLLPNQSGSVEASHIEVTRNGRAVSGWSRYSGGWGAGPYTVYFHAELDTSAAQAGTFIDDAISSSLRQSSLKKDVRIGGYWRFAADSGQSVQIKIGISFRSVERAKQHLTREMPAWDIAKAIDAGRETWNARLKRIAVTGDSDAQSRQFYTALYHAQLMPRERTGEFERFAVDATMWDDHYAVWDTWRTKYPLMLLIDPQMVRGTIQSFVTRRQVDGHVRDSFVAGTPGRMRVDQGGNDLDNIIADAHSKGLGGVDWEAAYAVMKHNADTERRGNFRPGGSVPSFEQDTDHYRRHGWLPPGIMNVSNTLEYAYNDFLVAQVAAALGKQADADHYAWRSRRWQLLYNPEATEAGFKGFIVPRTSEGKWVDVDLTAYPGSWNNYFYEAASWGYSFFTPHQPSRLIALMGGRETFVRRLEHGLKSGKVDFSNEPAFLAPALFHYAGRPDLSAKWVRAFATRKVDMAGYPGDDDSGAMSSYYVWAAMGLFPIAGQDIYVLNGPMFDRIKLDRPEDGALTITRSGSGDFVGGVKLNGKTVERSWLRHHELGGDAHLHFSMVRSPGQWGRGVPPPSDDSAVDSVALLATHEAAGALGDPAR